MARLSSPAAARVGMLMAVMPIVVLAGCGSPEENAQKYYESGVALIATKDDVAARLELLKAVKYRNDNLEVWKALAGVDERTKAPQPLFLDLRRIVELDPNDLDARLKLASIMVRGGAAEAALKVVDAAKEGDTPNAQLHALRAVILLKTSDHAGATREAEQAFEIDPANVDAASLIAAKKLADGDADGALKLLESLHVEPKDETRIALEKMQIYGKKGDLPAATQVLRKLIALNPGETVFRAQLIQFLIAQKQYDEAEKELRAKVAASPEDSKSGLELARFLLLTKGRDAARMELESRIASGGDVFDYRLALSELDIAQSRLGEAGQTLHSLVDTASTVERKAQAQLKLVELLLSKSDVGAAEPVIADILEKDRHNTGALKFRAAIHIERKEFDGAVSDLREALNDQPKAPDLLMMLADAYERGGKNELADRQYADALKSSGFNPDMALRYVTFLQRKGDPAHAEDILTEVASRSPSNLQVLSALAQVKLSRKNWDGAMATADAIGKIDDGRSVADQIRAAALAGQNKTDESIGALEDAHQANPDAAQPVLSLVSAYVRQGKPDKAAALLLDMSKKFPENSQLLVLLGQVRLAQDKQDEALQNFKDAVAKQPKDPIGYAALSELYTRQKNYAAAADVLQAGLKELPDNAGFELSLAGLQILKGDHDAAIAQYETILKQQPNSLVAINNLVSLLLDNRSDKASLDHAFSLADALKDTKVPQFQDTVGWAAYRRGAYDSAVSILEGAAAKLPDNASVHYHLGMSYAAAGQSDKAADQLKTALNLEPDGTPLKASIRSAMK
jgi:cellulose synthase operon protein C